MAHPRMPGSVVGDEIPKSNSRRSSRKMFSGFIEELFELPDGSLHVGVVVLNELGALRELRGLRPQADFIKAYKTDEDNLYTTRVTAIETDRGWEVTLRSPQDIIQNEEKTAKSKLPKQNMLFNVLIPVASRALQMMDSSRFKDREAGQKLMQSLGAGALPLTESFRNLSPEQNRRLSHVQQSWMRSLTGPPAMITELEHDPNKFGNPQVGDDLPPTQEEIREAERLRLY